MERDRNVLFQGAVPENYDRYLGPVIFEPWAEDLVSRLANKKNKRVLEIACGTGIVTRRLRDALPATIEIVATDLNSDMFEFAKPKFGDDENVIWQQADASAVPFPDCSFDAAVCQFGVMFVPDKAAAMRESYRVLRGGGVFLFNVWDSLEMNPFGQIAHTTIASFFDRDPPRFMRSRLVFTIRRSSENCCKTLALKKLNLSLKRSRAEAAQRENSPLAWCAAIRRR